jgi:transcriptional regulator with XRE-family HTH domain
VKLQALLKDLRKEQGVKQQELADRLERPQSKLESGERNIDIIELFDVIVALDSKPEIALLELLKAIDTSPQTI